MKIAVVAKKVESAVTYYRATVPIGHLCRRQGWQMAVFAPKDLTLDVMHYFDIIFLHRPISSDEISLIWTARQIGVKSWVDVDDLIWRIPVSNPAVAMFGTNERYRFTQAILNADAVTCSTPGLAREIETEFGRHAVVIPNAWAGGEVMPFDKREGRKRILYRGSNTHDGDLYSHREAFYPRDRTDFTFMGTIPWYFYERYGGSFEGINHERWTNNVATYFARIREMNPHFFIVPLEANDFNYCKSNIAAMEATEAGAVTIYPEYLPEFAKFPGMPYRTVGELTTILDTIDDQDPATFLPVWEAARDYLETLHIDKVNEIRKEIAKHLTESA